MNLPPFIAGELWGAMMMSVCGISAKMSYTPLGKPYTPSRPDVAFSITHSGSLAACALTLDGDHIEQPLSIGVDIQRADGSGSAEMINDYSVAMVLSEAEVARYWRRR